MTNEETIVPEAAEPKTDIIWLLNCTLITLVAAFLRFFDLGLKPFHHDEGVNGYFLTSLFREGVYRYDPANYHGPTLYYISLAFAKVFGLETIPLRASVAIFGVLTVVLVFFLKRYIGKIGALSAGLFLALSPGMVFISRYFIHEIFFVFLSLAIALSILFFIDRRKAGGFAIGWMVLLLLVCFLPSALNLAFYLGGDSTSSVWAFRIAFFIIEAVLVYLIIRMLLVWNDGRPIYLLLASGSAALMFATKETAFITIGTMLIACVCIVIWQKIYRKKAEDDYAETKLSWANFREGLGGRGDLPLMLAAAALFFLYITILFFSSFFTYPEGIQKAVEAYMIWTKTGSKDHTQNGLWAYVNWGWAIEAPILILSVVGIVVAFVKARHKFAMFAALWAFGLFAAYSIIPYKTPWLALSFLLPMCIAAGYGINELARSKNIAAKALAAILAAGGSGVLAYQSYDLNFVNYDDNSKPYIYAHTRREFLDLIREIERYADKSGKGKETAVDIVSPDYWPMVWYLKDYPKAIFRGSMYDTPTSEMIIAKKDTQDAQVIAKYSANYRFAGTYGLRPGVDLILLVRKDLADANTKEVYRVNEK